MMLQPRLQKQTPKDLWDEAYNLFRNDKDKKKLMDGYEKFLETPPSSQDSTQPAVEAARARLTIGKETYVIKEKVDKIISAIIYAKDFITAAASLEPHAALAWAGVSVLLPVTLLSRYIIATPVYFSETEVQQLEVAFESKTVKLYSQILEHQIRLAYQCTRVKISRSFRDIVLADDWKAMLTEVKECEQSISKDLHVIDGHMIMAINVKTSTLVDSMRKMEISVERSHREERERYLHRLPRAEGAAFDSNRLQHEPLCLKDTRASMLRLIYEWSETPHGQHVFWLSGMAGTGKSTIARTVARRFSERGQLEPVSSSRKARVLSPMPPTSGRKTNGSISSGSHCPKSILRRCSITPSAFQEFKGCRQRQATNFRHEQARAANRPWSTFQEETGRDISAFLQHELTLVRKKSGLAEDWPKVKDVEKLVQKANGLFIYAATACKFIGDTNFLPKKQLSTLLKKSVRGNSQRQKLDKMYMQVLTQSILSDCELYDQPRVLERFRKVVGYIVILCESLRVRDLSHLLPAGGGESGGRGQRDTNNEEDDEDDKSDEDDESDENDESGGDNEKDEREDPEEEVKITLNELGSVLDVSNLTEVAP
ncbi:uncharacterized protein BDZ99DRAFT_498848 [Mytilinidion resinicola]|uniref:NWD NACHT-NTPase N-terminal domain-containing protein n=1 Tax=Mytilinidion resinicola TaxID=574789 RepID=A0A6A6YLU5_9PEZI|nr:uncharacterized protein BDZ99DRAFT_498848 [Mytilinidion resinicola]KAF2809508.1 hypothetical protein BDZ99DRAFT_498848 [Mytilinidion resinicola]